MIRVVGLDLSLTSTGVARCTIEDNGDAHTATQLVESQAQDRPDMQSRWVRLDRLAGDIAAAVWLGNGPTRPDLVLVEAPTYAGTVTGSQHDRSGLWWLVMHRLLSQGVPVVEINPVHLKIYATGSGRAKKPDVINGVRQHWGHLFDLPVSKRGQDDTADAITLAAMAAHTMGWPLNPYVAPEQTRAISMADLHKRASRVTPTPKLVEL